MKLSCARALLRPSARKASLESALWLSFKHGLLLLLD